MCDETVDIEPLSLAYVLDRFKTQGICNKAVRREPYTLVYVPDHLRTQEMDNIYICYIVGYTMSFNVFEGKEWVFK